MKIRNGYVSNSSSSSFILKNKDDLKYFQEMLPYQQHKVYEVNQLKRTLHNIIKQVVDYYFEHGCVNTEEIWNLYMKDNVPEYFEWSDIRFNLEFLDFSSIIKFVEALPSEGYLTESYDRDRFAEYCRIPLDKYELFKKDL